MSRASSRQQTEQQRPDQYAGRRVARKPSRRDVRDVGRHGSRHAAVRDDRREPAPAVPVEQPASRLPEPLQPSSPSAPSSQPSSLRRRLAHGAGLALWLLVVAGGAAALVASVVGTVDARVGDGGAVAVSTAYTWGLAARTGGRPVLFSLLALVLGGVAMGVDSDPLRSGAAVLTAVLAAVFAVMVTVPAVHLAGAVRENVVALVVAAVGALATVGWSPVVDLQRFQYTVLGLSFVAAFLVVHRLGAGFHGLGTRGVLTVVLGGLVLAVCLGYAALLQRYGTQTLITALDDAVRWCHHHLGAFPRPIVALLGVPALTWGTHMRARRRQGWWVCLFGVAMTAPVAYALVDPGRSVLEVALAAAYGVVIGLVIGAVLIRLDLRFTAPRGRRLKETEEATAVRPEPGRTHALW